ncbi:hypothetical protein [Anaeromyxobacter paludicola]|uniref:Uncharacterized protein n=1 Tax=Anaeromyxobacter paludicola TaxID=2918171 RepID=A0ABM7XEX1_9BACT|nr:hypothetical protein [Anaeromyxobacter paludicola]BDG10440.1 hypothetical protein AMPC_35530 [Anaeromyxobacter paludicola]
MTAPDPALLELLRERSGLSIDLEGRFLHRGEPITHARTLAVLWGSLERAPDGRYLVHVGRESGYVRLADAPYVVRAVSEAPGGPVLHLTDGTSEPLAPATLTVDGEGVLHARVKGGHRARFSRAAQVTLGLALEEDPSAPAGFALRQGGTRHPLGKE